MPTIIAIFDDMKGLQDAQDELQRHGFGDAVRRVVDQGADDAEGSAPIVAGSQKQGAVTGYANTTPGGFLDGMDLPDGEAEFVQDAIADGARVLVLDPDEPDRAADLLRPHAQRVVHAG